MQIETARFGQMTIDPDRIITFPEGFPGFADQRFILLTPAETAPFCWLQSVDSPEVALVVIHPDAFIPEYTPKIPRQTFEKLKMTPQDELLILSVAVIPADIKKITVNLAAPILINVEGRLARQEILSSGDYPLRCSLYPALQNQGGGR